MGVLKSERHHWWPQCVSEFWKGEDGCVSRLQCDGDVKRMPPKNYGVIGNGHAIKLASNANDTSPWDESFEREFDKADRNFPSVIRWLQSLPFEDRRGSSLKQRWVTQKATDEMLGNLLDGIVSLAVRSPRMRENAVALAEHLRGELPARQRNVLIGSNMKGVQETIVRNIGTRGKFAIIHSPDKELIFGDGFYNTLIATRNAQMSPHILAPLTPEIAVLYASPTSYTVEPRVTSMVFGADEADILNQAVQVYSSKWLYYRSQRPEPSEAFQQGRHLRYSDPNHPIEQIVRTIPGVPPRDHEFDEFIRTVEAERSQ